MAARLALALFVGFAALGLWIYGPALEGAFVSDDAIYVADNPFVQELSAGHLVEIVKPWGVVPVMVRNYAPVHLLLHGLEWRLFGADVLGYHVVNVLLHAGACVLLALLLARSGLGPRGAALGGALFLLHPANVEAVAWISQLKTVSALFLALAALLLLPRRPAGATACFGLALLAKASAAVALPAAALFAWLHRAAGPEPRKPARWRWLGLWTLLFAAFAAAQLAAFATDEPAAPLDPDPRVRVLSSAGIGLRYLIMSASTWGLSTFHEPEPVRSVASPWLLGGLAALALLAWRTLHCLRERRPEAAWWLWAFVSFLPVSQALPFRYAMADRYLYFILPGLIGGTLLATRDLLAIAPGRERGALQRGLAAVAAVAALSLLGLFGVRAHARAAVWRTPLRVVVDAAAHYPGGTHAGLLRARSAASAGDAGETVAALRTLLEEKGWNRFQQLQADPAYRRVRDDPRFRALLAEMAGQWIRHFSAGVPSALELRLVAAAHELRGETAEAEAALERGIAMGGAFEPQLRAELAELRARRERGRTPPPPRSAR